MDTPPNIPKRETTPGLFSEKPEIEIRPAGDQTLLFVRGDWTATHIEVIDRLCTELGKNPRMKSVQGLDLREAGALDTSGAFLLNTLRAPGLQTAPRPKASSDFTLLPVFNASPEHMALLNLVLEKPDAGALGAKKARPSGMKRLCNLPVALVNQLGKTIWDLGDAALERLSFFGEFVAAMGRSLIRPAHFRFTSMVYHMEQTGVNAIPIVCLLAFLIGTVLAYMTAGQLASFGAEIFVVKLLEVGVMREMGVLITAILVAGRSGSSFTAQIGSMLANQEVDAMRSMGIDPMGTLVVPRMLALVIMLPALVLMADLAGMFGGLCAVWLSLDITPQVFMETLQKGINFGNILAGLIKAPFFALVVGGIGCFTGFKAGSSADSVGRMTTQAVVESIFLVITLDALFALFFSQVGF